MDIHRSVEAGRNRSLKLLRKGVVRTVWIASDADRLFAEQMTEAARKVGLEPDRRKTGKQLANMCNVDVFTAVAVEKIMNTDS